MADPKDKLAPFFSASETDQSAVLVTVSIVSSAVSALAIAAKLFWRRNIYSLKHYDHALLVSAVLLFVHTGLQVHAASLGVGKHRADVGEDILVPLRKTEYASALLWILVGGLTKLSMCLFIASINTYNDIFTANRILMGTVGLLSLATFLATSFRCSLPSPWLAESASACPAAVPIYQFTLVSSMVTDALICALAIPMICKVQTAVKTKVFVIFLFSFRLVCVATTVPALIETAQLYNAPSDLDYTWLSLQPSVWLAATANCFVITACIPSLKGLFDSWLGNTLGLDIDAPYQLERMQGKNTFEAKPYETGYGGSGGSGGSKSGVIVSSSKSRETLAGAGTPVSTPAAAAERRSGTFAGLRLGPAAPNQAACYSDNDVHRNRSISGNGKRSRRRDPNQISDDDEDNDAHDSESVTRLTGGIVIQEEVEVRFHGNSHERSRSDLGRSWSPTV